MKFLAIDFGERRLGLALSDPDGKFALPHSTLARRKNGLDWRGDIADLLAIIKIQAVEALVFGQPRGLEWEGESEKAARQFAERLQNAAREADLDLPLHWWDERFSSSQALRELGEAGISQYQARHQDGANSTDARAAALILQGFLDFQNRPFQNRPKDIVAP